MRVALLFPPATDPRGPHLSLPSLAAHLRRQGATVDLYDLDIAGLHWLLDPERLGPLAARCQARYDRLDADRQAAAAPLMGQADWIVASAAEAAATLQDLEGFLDPDRHHLARRTIGAALRLASGSTGGRVTYAIAGAAYDVAGVDPSRLPDLLAVTADPTADLFDDHTREVLLPALARTDPDVVGISILNRQQIIPGLFLARRLKAAGRTVVLGGTVYAKFHDALRQRSRFFETFCDALVPYEGETAMTALLDALAGGADVRDLGHVPNLLSLDRHGRVVAGPTHVENVKALPTPDFDGMPLDAYLNPVPVLPIVTGKGCYFNRCKFCDIPSINSISKKAYRLREPDQIALDIATLHERHGARHFEITDEALAPKLLLRLADALDDHPGVDPRFVGYARFEPGFTPEVCDRLHAMGMRKLFFGLESGNQAMLDHMDKGIRVETAHDVLRACAGAGIGVHVFSIVGFPEETEAQARDTLTFLLEEHATLDAPMHTFDVHPFGLDLRTEYGEEPERFGVEVDRSQLDGVDFPITLRGWRNTRGLTPEEAGALLEEFATELATAYRGWRAYPDQQWPGFEEYAVVYGDHYGPTPGGRPFPWRMALPPDDDPRPYALVWAPDITVAPAADPDLAVVRGIGGDRHTPAALVPLLRDAPGPDTTPGHLDRLVGALAGDGPTGPLRDQVRAVLDDLLASRALWLRPA